MITKIVVAVFLFILMILCQNGVFKAIREKDNKSAILGSIAAMDFGLVSGVLLGSLIS